MASMIRWMKASKWNREIVERLPKHYRDFRMDYENGEKTPVHFRPVEIYEKVGNEIKRRENYPIPLIFPPESHKGLWGGEGVIKGYKKRHYKATRKARWWFPRLQRSVLYSEILNEHMEINVTWSTLNLIDKYTGFDNYILKSKPCDLQSQLALDIRRQMLLALVREKIYPNDSEKRKEILEKYKEHIIPEEEAEWWGLSFSKSLEKQKEIVENTVPTPLKQVYRAELFEKLKEGSSTEEFGFNLTPEIDQKEQKSSLLNRLNPFKR